MRDAIKLLCAPALFLLSFTDGAGAHAQNANRLEDYTPPPMFAAPPARERKAPETLEETQNANAALTPEDVLLSARKPVTRRSEERRQMASFRTPGTVSRANPGEYVSAPKPKKRPETPRARAYVVKTPPLPPRRPANLIKASIRTGNYLRKPAQTDIPDMPALPAGRVEKQTLYAPQPDTKPESRENRPARIEPAAGTTARLADPLFLNFKTGAHELDNAHRAALRQAVVTYLQQNPHAMLSIAAYARDHGDSLMSAKRISLNRALSVRAFLIASGISANRINVRALGDETGEKPLDRVDLVFAQQK